MEIAVTAVGLAVGVLFGVFGAGASAFATPVLALVGVPGLAAVASPLPATVPAAAAAAWSYIQRREMHWATARRALLGGVPGAVIGAFCSPLLGGEALLVLSAVLLAVLGARLLRPARATEPTGPLDAPAPAIASAAVVVPLAAGAGFLAGLLANSGGFLLVPLFLLVVGLGMRQAAGTSLVTAAVLSLPTVATHWMLGDIDWAVAGWFALGLIPGSIVGGRVAEQVPEGKGQRAFGVVLVGLAAVFFLRRLG